MAIDTLAKRNSVLSVSTIVLPIPDGTIDQGDRQTLLRIYSGILAEVASGLLLLTQQLSISLGLRIGL